MKLTALFSPVSVETRALLRQRWQQLPEQLKTPRQVVGQHWVQCGFITGPSYCSFGCTHCYLPKDANHQRQPGINEIKAQLDANRRLLGPGGHIQITGGDVVDAYVNTGRFDDLIEIVRYSSEIGLVPMLMTHGQSLLQQPDRLEQLVNKGLLRKISFHIDMTQAGRCGYPLKSLRREADLNPLRDEFTELILRTRRATGQRLVGAQTVTVTSRNIDSIGDILSWLMSARKHQRAFSTISFQPEANVGRTRFSAQPVCPERVWQEIETATGKKLIRDALHFGHPDCSSICFLLVDSQNKRVVDLLKPSRAMQQFWHVLLRDFGGVGGRGAKSLTAWWQKILLLVKRPSIIPSAIRYSYSTLSREPARLQLASAALRGQVGVVKIVMHNFIHAKALENPDQTIQARLDACSFRGAIQVDGDWQAIPMCLANAKYR